MAGAEAIQGCSVVDKQQPPAAGFPMRMGIMESGNDLSHPFAQKLTLESHQESQLPNPMLPSFTNLNPHNIMDHPSGVGVGFATPDQKLLASDLTQPFKLKDHWTLVQHHCMFSRPYMPPPSADELLRRDPQLLNFLKQI